jgi:TonB family protein
MDKTTKARRSGRCGGHHLFDHGFRLIALPSAKGGRLKSWMGFALSAGLVAFPAHAQQVPPEPAPSPRQDAASPDSPHDGDTAPGATLVPPKPIDTTVAYPDGASGPADVLLEIVVGAGGHVEDAQIVSGAPPFGDAALAASKGWSFEPARRDGQPVSARIRYKFHFEPPKDEREEFEEPYQEPSRPAPAPPSGAPKPPAEPIEVTIRGQVEHPGSVTVTSAEARELPGTFGDPLRAIEAQPGVVPIVSGVPSFFIRGAPPANVGFFIDGVDVPLLYHGFLGPSVIHPALIDSVDFYRSAPPVEYGRFAGPIVEANLTALDHRFGAEGSVRAIDAGALLQVPFGPCAAGETGECAPGAARISGRYAYAGLVLSLLSDAKLEYWDYQGQVTYRLGADDTLGVLAFGAFDYFRASGEPIANQGARVQFHRLDLRYDRRLAAGTTLRLAVTGGYDRTAGTDPLASALTDRSVRGRVELSTVLGSSATLRAGFDGRADRYDLETEPLSLTFPDYTVLFPARTEYVAGAYVALELRPERRITVVPGVRADFYSASGATALGVDPRISAAFELSPDVTVTDSLSLAHQQANFAAQVPAAEVADLGGGLESALLASSELKVKLPSNMSASAAVFHHVYYDALDPVGGARNFSIDRTVLQRRSTISAYGIELGFSRSLSRKLGAMISYTLSLSRETTGNLTAVSGFDRPHVLQVALSYDFGAGFRAGARSVLYSGVPELNLEGSPHLTAERRGPAYFRLDLRLEKRWRLGERGYWGAVAEVLNATSTREVIRLDCGSICVERFAGPVVLPSLGIEAGY